MSKNILLALITLGLAGTGKGQHKTDHTGSNYNNKEWVREFYVSFNDGNIDLIGKLVADDYIEHEPLPGFEPNKKGLIQFFTMMRTAFPDLKNEINFMIEEENRVVSYITMSGTHKADYLGIPATNKKFSISVIDIIEIKDGKMIAHWGVGDYYTQFVQLGVIEE